MNKTDNKRQALFPIKILLLAGGLLSVVLFLAYSRHTLNSGAREKRVFSHGESLARCRENCRLIGVALEMYGLDNDGVFPDGISKLKPDYLETIPTCPSAGADTYSGTYQHFHSPSGQRRFTFFCRGDHHTREPKVFHLLGYPITYGESPTHHPEDFPRFVSGDGLVMPAMQPQE